MTANVNKSAILVGNEDKRNPVGFKWKWGEEELPFVNQYTYLGVKIIHKNGSWGAHIIKVIEKSKAQIDRQDGRNPKRIASRY